MHGIDENMIIMIHVSLISYVINALSTESTSLTIKLRGSLVECKQQFSNAS